MTNAFHWQGKPSIFTTNARQQPFGMAREVNRIKTSLRKKAMPVTLGGSSVYRAPQMVIAKTPRRGA